MNFLNNKFARVLTLVLLLQGATYYAVASRAEQTPTLAPLAIFPQVSGGWRTTKEIPLEKEVLDLLKADDTLNREYLSPQGTRRINFLMEFFKTQRNGQAPHSPKNCLPGSGYEPLETHALPIAVPGRPEPIVVNAYLVARGAEKSVVLYWYQSHNRIIASEYAAKFWLVMDAIRYRRSDTAMVRVVVPVRESEAPADAMAEGEKFVQAVFPDIARQLPT
jgi:EpsI family protein